MAWLVGEMVNTLPSQGNIHGFKSRTSHQFELKSRKAFFFGGKIWMIQSKELMIFYL